jgi:hypothetical protein
VRERIGEPPRLSSFSGPIDPFNCDEKSHASLRVVSWLHSTNGHTGGNAEMLRQIVPALIRSANVQSPCPQRESRRPARRQKSPNRQRPAAELVVDLRRPLAHAPGSQAGEHRSQRHRSPATDWPDDQASNTTAGLRAAPALGLIRGPSPAFRFVRVFRARHERRSPGPDSAVLRPAVVAIAHTPSAA